MGTSMAAWLVARGKKEKNHRENIKADAPNEVSEKEKVE